MAAGLDRPTDPHRNIEIFMEWVEYETTIQELAEEYGLADQTIRAIIDGVIHAIGFIHNKPVEHRQFIKGDGWWITKGAAMKMRMEGASWNL